VLIDLGNGAHRLHRALRSRVLRHLGGFRSCGAASIDPGVRIDNPGGMALGDGVLLLRGTWLYCIPTPGGTPDLVLGDRTYVGFHSHITCARKVRLGAGCLLSNGVYVSDNLHGYQDVTRDPILQPLRLGEIDIGDGTWLGEHAAVFGTVRLGRHCVVGANSVVSDMEAPDFSVLVGAPARIVKRLDPESGEWRATEADGRFR
jgi:acetyltransferase-like isoleucine patch superfamily enzyme